MKNTTIQKFRCIQQLDSQIIPAGSVYIICNDNLEEH